nr:glutamate receptor 2.8-like isoform X2 [Ziziphus jujuba var. spinosa]
MAIYLMLLIFSTWLSHCVCVEPFNYVENGSIGSKQAVRVGVVIDLDSDVGKIAENYTSMALSDFYTRYADYRTRLNVAVKNYGKDDVIFAASAALELMKNEQVEAIIGPHRSSEAKFVIGLGERAQVPIISFSATSPTLSPTQSPFFIRTCHDDYSQIKPLTSIVQAFGWRQIIIIYEDTEFGNGLIPYLADALQEIDARIVYRSVISKPKNIPLELEKIKAMETRVILVHMTDALGSRLFLAANQTGMMSKGYVWMITDGLSTLLHSLEKQVTESMQGVLGIRPHVPNTNRLQEFKTRWKISEINLFGLWAYDTIWALAKAVELVSESHSNASTQSINNGRNIGEAFLGLRVSESGPVLLEKLKFTRFEGLSGKFRLIRGQSEVSEFEIVNVRRKMGERVIGYWTKKKGISSDSWENAKTGYLSSMHELIKGIIWPGYAKAPPKGWNIPVTGFTYDVFIAALEKLPFQIPHTFVPFVNSSRQSNGTYDEFLYQIKLQKFDAVVADATITANRSTYVDFTMPYSESGVSMVVKVNDKKNNNIWIFLKPLKWDLWLSSGLALFFTGFVVWLLEHRTNREFRGRPDQQLSTILWFSFSTLVFAHREKVENNWSRFVLIIWVFVVLILTQSYTASLATMLTVQRLQPSVVDVNELRMNDYFVGYQKNSYVRELLTGQLNLNESRLRHYSTPEEYHDALSKGSKNGGVEAIFDEIPYIKLFLAKYCSGYTMVGPKYKSDGFGFAFPSGSPLVYYFSRAILNITEDHNKMQEMEEKYFADQTKCQDSAASSTTSSGSSPSLSVCNFGGLFIITGLASIFSCVIYFVKFQRNNNIRSSMNAIHSKSSLWSRTTQMLKNCACKDLPLRAESNMRS